MRPRPNKDLPGKVCLGAVSGAIGVRGEVRIKPFTADPFAVGAYGSVETASGTALNVKVVREVKGGVAARIDGVTDRNKAEALKGEALYIARASLPAPEDEDEFYYADLIGLNAVSETGESLGTVTAVQDFGAGDLLELRLAADGRKVFVPFTKAIVPEVDVKAGKVTVAPPEGLLDKASEADRKDEER